MPTWLPWPDSICDGLRVKEVGEVLHLTLVSAQTRNAQTPALWRRLAEVGACLPDSIRVVVIDAEGPSFSAGLDRRMFTPEGIPDEHSLADLATAPFSTADTWIAEFQSAFSWQRTCNAITIAVVQGHAVGAGFQLALACDLVIAAEDAQFSMREVSLGLVPDLGGTQRLVELVGLQRALLACSTGGPIDGRTATAWGIAAVSATPADLATSAQLLVDQLLGLPHESLRAIKPLLQDARRRTPAEQHAAERAAQIGLLRGLAGASTRPEVPVTEPVTPTNSVEGS